MIRLKFLLGVGIFYLLFTGVSVNAQSFADVPTTNHYYQATQFLSERGVISGYPDGLFRPDNPVSRVELLKIILGYFGDNKSFVNIPNFSDVDNKAWYTPYVTSAFGLGLVNGYPDGSFKPAQTVLRVEALKILFREAGGVESDFAQIMQLYLDIPYQNKIWYLPYVNFAVKYRLIIGNNKYFYPARPMTRGEVTQMIFNYDRNVAQIKGGVISNSISRKLPLVNTIPIVKSTSSPVISDPISIVKPLLSVNNLPIYKASYYADKYNNAVTASGEVFHQTDFSAAHRLKPFGSLAFVTNIDTSKGVFVRINDRGPFINGRDIDLSTTSFNEIANLSQGVINTNIDYLDGTFFPRKTYAKTNFFEGIKLTKPLPDIFLRNETYEITGELLNNEQSLIATVTDNTGYAQNYPAEIFTGTYNGSNISHKFFRVRVFFDHIGKNTISLFRGNNTQSYALPVVVLAKEPLHYTSTSLRNTISALKINIKNAQAKLNWTDNKTQFTDEERIYRIKISQNNITHTFFTTSINYFTFTKKIRQQLSDLRAAPATISISSAIINTYFSIDRFTDWSTPESIKVNLILAQPSSIDSGLQMINFADTYNNLTHNLYFAGQSARQIEPNLMIIKPNGLVDKLPLNITNGTNFNFNFKPQMFGTYQLEVNGSNGEAIWNKPLYFNGDFPILPSNFDMVSKISEPTFNQVNMVNKALLKINNFRSQYNINPLKLDQNLTKLAQYRANDLARGVYFGHVNQQGKVVNDYRLNYGVVGYVSENIASARNLDDTEFGLEWSAGHRSLLLDPDLDNIGIGVAIDTISGNFILVQNFTAMALNAADIVKLHSTWDHDLYNFSKRYLIPINNIDNFLQTWVAKLNTNNVNIWENELRRQISITSCGTGQYAYFNLLNSNLSTLHQQFLNPKNFVNTSMRKFSWQMVQLPTGEYNLIAINCN